jgi:hypothetical protein
METPSPRCPIRRSWNPSPDPGKERLRDHMGGSSGEFSPIKFSSFSLGDVFERETNKFGRFAFRRKNQQEKHLRDLWMNLSSSIRKSMAERQGKEIEGLFLRILTLERGQVKKGKINLKPGRIAHHSPTTHLELV